MRVGAAAGVAPGDVILVRSKSRPGWVIRVGAAIADKPSLVNHVAVVDHSDAHGTVWCIEGRPGGVGWRDATAYLASPWLITNAAQPKTTAQRQAVCEAMRAMLGTPYDWQAIVADGAADLAAAAGWTLPWEPSWKGTVPGHVVCSSAACFAYTAARLAGPGGGRTCQPGDWEGWITRRGWLPAGGGA